MDRFQWCGSQLEANEHTVANQIGVRIYDGESKTSFDYGDLTLTTNRLLWKAQRESAGKCISMHLSLVVYVEEESAGIGRSPKIAVHVTHPPSNKPPGPLHYSPNCYIKFSFREGGATHFCKCLVEEITRKRWQPLPVPSITPSNPTTRQVRAGIVGIERKIQERQKETSANISKAFEDLNKLMEMARDMVGLAKTISTKIKEKQGDISEDETIRFKSYLLSLGIEDPVTRESHGSGSSYHKELARELATFLEQPIKDVGGMMALTDVYCRVNRARGLELLSPEDLLNALKMLEPLRLPIRLRVFDSGVMVLQLQTLSENEVVQQITKMLEEKGSLTAEELSQLLGQSVVLAKERLLTTEKFGGACIDDSSEGLRFYPNRFLTQGTS